MLTDEQIAENSNKFVELIKKLNFDADRFLKYLNSPRVDFFYKPYNSKSDNAYAGSLCERCLLTYNELVKLCDIYAKERYSEEQIIEVALLGNIYRAELYEAYTRNVKNDETGQWESVVAYRTKEQRPIFGDIGFSSYMIAKKFIELDDEVAEAICYSSLSNTNTMDGYSIRSSYPLVTLTTIAELAGTYLN